MHALLLLVPLLAMSGGKREPAPAATTPAATVTPAEAHATPRATGEPKVGDVAPDFSLPADDGSTFTLSTAKKPVVVVFYPRAFTGG